MPLIQKHLSKNIVTILIALLVIGYIAFNFRIFVAGPGIEIISPVNGSVSQEKLVLLNGVATRISYISLNGRPILVNEEGHFNESLLLNPGYNIITLEAKDKFDRSITKKIELVYKGEKTEMKIDNLSSTSTLQGLLGTTTEEDVSTSTTESTSTLQE